MNIAKEFSRFIDFLKRLGGKLPEQAENIEHDLEHVEKVLTLVRIFVPKNLKDEVDRAIRTIQRLRQAADQIEEISK